MSDYIIYQQGHCTYVCQYHIVWITKYRKALLKNNTQIKQEIKRILKLICKWKQFKILAWHIGAEHIHLYIIIPPKYSISYAMSVLKGKSSTWLRKKKYKYYGKSFWARGYFVSTIGLNEHQIRNYIENQKHNQIDPPTLPFNSDN